MENGCWKMNLGWGLNTNRTNFCELHELNKHHDSKRKAINGYQNLFEAAIKAAWVFHKSSNLVA
jgi:hypothetical protein